MPYAGEGRISQDAFEGAIEITSEQYADALDGMISGKLVTIEGGFAVIDPPPPPEPEPVPDRSAAVNGAALEERRKETAKDEAAALASAGDFEAAFRKILELI